MKYDFINIFIIKKKKKKCENNNALFIFIYNSI